MRLPAFALSVALLAMSAFGEAPRFFSGYFLQLWIGYGVTDSTMFADQAYYDRWLKGLADVGAEFVIIQSTITRDNQNWVLPPGDSVVDADYAWYQPKGDSVIMGIHQRSYMANLDYAGAPKQGGKQPVDYILEAAKNNGMKVYLGLYLDAQETSATDWWSVMDYRLLDTVTYSGKIDYASSYWRRARNAYEYHKLRSVQVLNELCDLYGDHEALAGFYFVPEIAYTQAMIQDSSKHYVIDMIRPVVEAAHACKSTFTLAVSPYVGSVLPYPRENPSPEGYGDWWEDVLSATGIDLMYLQDGIGANPDSLTEEYDAISGYEREIKRACDNSGTTTCWGNVEIYHGTGPRMTPSTLEKVRLQMDAFAPYAEKLVAFSYHYIDTMQAASLEMDSAAVARFYADYRDYYLRNFASVAERRTVASRLPGGALAGDLFRIPGGEARWELRDAAGRVMGSGRGSEVRMPEATGFYALHLERPSGAHDMALWRVPGGE